jgi:hypothetical protein
MLSLLEGVLLGKVHSLHTCARPLIIQNWKLLESTQDRTNFDLFYLNFNYNIETIIRLLETCSWNDAGRTVSGRQ